MQRLKRAAHLSSVSNTTILKLSQERKKNAIPHTDPSTAPPRDRKTQQEHHRNPEAVTTRTRHGARTWKEGRKGMLKVLQWRRLSGDGRGVEWWWEEVSDCSGRGNPWEWRWSGLEVVIVVVVVASCDGRHGVVGPCGAGSHWDRGPWRQRQEAQDGE